MYTFYVVVFKYCKYFEKKNLNLDKKWSYNSTNSLKDLLYNL